MAYQSDTVKLSLEQGFLQGDTVQDSAEYIIRAQGNRAYTFGLGEVVAPNCTYFAAGNYDLTKEQLNKKLKALGKVTLGN